MRRYPDFDVLAEQDAWDPHTREIVLRRTAEPSPLTFLTSAEERTLTAVLRHLLYEHRQDRLRYVVAEFDRRLPEPQGEAQRPPDSPPQADLVREGLAALERASHELAGTDFSHANPNVQLDLVSALQNGKLMPPAGWSGPPQQAFFKKLLGIAVEAYYSHPDTWSEIGYAGPAYPRGYVRIESGLTDPWEARER